MKQLADVTMSELANTFQGVSSPRLVGFSAISFLPSVKKGCRFNP